MIKLKSLIEGNICGDIELLYKKDQRERNLYKDYLSKSKNWKEASKLYAKNNGRDLNDIFGDKNRLNKAKYIIKQNIDNIKTNSDCLDKCWLLVQHMDDDVNFQEWFLQFLKKGTSNWKYLTDRILVNKGKSQKFGTQNVTEFLKEVLDEIPKDIHD